MNNFSFLIALLLRFASAYMQSNFSRLPFFYMHILIYTFETTGF